MLLSAFAISLLPQIVNNIFDNAIIKNDIQLLIYNMLLYIFACIFYNIIDMNNNILFTKTGAMVVKDIREALCINISQKNGDYYTKLKTGDIANRILAEVEYIENFITQNLFIILSDIVTVVAIGIVLTSINFKIMSIVLIIQPIVIIIQNKFGKKSTKLTRKFRATYQNMCSATTEFLNNIMNIIFANAVPFYFNNYKRMQDNVIRDAVETQKNGNRSYFFQDIISSLVTIILIGYGGISVINGQLSLGELIVFNMYINKIFGGINRLSKSYIKFKQFDVYLERIVEVFNDSNAEKRTKDFKFQNIVKFENVFFKYVDIEVLSGIFMYIKRGQRIAIVGESGSGKSTIINLLYAFWKCEKGKILIDDVCIDEIDITDLRRKISVVSQNTFFYNDTILNNITLGKEVDEDQVIEACKLACIHEYIMNLPDNYKTILQENGKNLSGGQKQRLSIARALIDSEAEIVCLDEPTSALDTRASQTIEKNLIMTLKDKTVITITHKVDLAQYYDYIFLFNKGKIVEEGKFTDLIDRKGEFYKLYMKEEYST